VSLVVLLTASLLGLAYEFFCLPLLLRHYREFMFVENLHYLTFLAIPLLVISGAILPLLPRDARLFNVLLAIYVLLSLFVIVNVVRLFSSMRAFARTF
jgi:hypothetical protein